MSRAIARRRDGLTHTVEIDGHEVITDEPVADGGNDLGVRPTRMLAVALASCTATTVAMYADRKGWDIEGTTVIVDFEGVAKRGDRTGFAVEVGLPPGLDDEQREKLMVIAGKCPVHRVLVEGADVGLRVAEEAA